MRLSLRFVLLVICAGALGCEPLSTDAPLLQEHMGGVVSQVTLSGDLAASSLVADESSEQSIDSKQPIEAESDPEPEGSESVVLAPATQGEQSPSALPQDDVSSSAVGPEDSLGPPPTAAPEEQLAPELSSGEYGGGSIVVQQASTVFASPGDAQAVLPVDSTDGVVEADLGVVGDANERSNGSGPVAAAFNVEPQKTKADESSPALVDGETLAIELSKVLPEGPSSDRSALAVFDALPRRSSRTSTEEPQDCIPAGSGLLALSLGQLSMVRAWLDGTLLRAELRGPDGRLYTVVRGDRVGADGGRVLQVSSAQVIVGEIGFGLDGNPFIVQEAIR